MHITSQHTSSVGKTMVITVACSLLFQILVSEPNKFCQKLKVHFEDFWNISDMLVIVLFVAGCVLCLIPAKSGYGKVNIRTALTVSLAECPCLSCGMPFLVKSLIVCTHFSSDS